MFISAYLSLFRHLFFLIFWKYPAIPCKMRKKIYSKYLSNNSEIKFKQLLKTERTHVYY